MKVLLLTDVPPGKNYTGTIVLDQLCRLLPQHSVVCFAVVHPALTDAKLTEDLTWIPIKYMKKPRERSLSAVLQRLPPFLRDGIIAKAMNFFAYCFEWFNELRVRTKFVNEAVVFAKEHQVDRVWALLEGQTMVRMALPVAKKLKVSLHTQVWDPFGLWLRSNQIDHHTTKRLLKVFDKTVALSQSCGVASFVMEKEYKDKYGVKAVPIIASFEVEKIFPPATKLRNAAEVIIGMAGQFYAIDEWRTLIRTLEECNWQIAGKTIKLRVFSRTFYIETRFSSNIEYLGWRSQAEVIASLAEADLLYLPYWFSAEYKEEAMLSFPSKLVTYFAAGRPVIFHGPAYASPSIYLANNNAGFICNSAESLELKKSIEQTINDAEQYEKITLASRKVFLRDFTLDKLKENFYQFLSQFPKM